MIDLQFVELISMVLFFIFRGSFSCRYESLSPVELTVYLLFFKECENFISLLTLSGTSLKEALSSFSFYLCASYYFGYSQ